MTRLGLRLTLRSGHEAFVRLMVTAASVAIGVMVLLSVLAGYHAYQVTSNRACWECTEAAPGSPAPARSELWNYSENIYKGQFIEELDVAALGAKAPLVPGLSRLPGAGQYYASPALAALIRSVPRDELGDRFPGSEVGTIGYQALSGPNELVIIVGYSPSKLAALPGTVTVDHIAAVPDVQGTTGIYRLFFGIGAIVVLFPLLILINTATRLAATRREERFAAMRLVGATPGQVNVIASVEAVVSALLGTLAGIGLFLAVRPALADISLSGARFFERTVTPTVLGYVVMIVAVPAAAAIASLWSLRRVRISPLGISRKVTPPAPGLWRLLPLLVGIPLFVVPLVTTTNNLGHNASSILPFVYLGTFLIMAGLVMSGPWLTMQAARVLGRGGTGASSLLASRRLADNPKGAFRTASGLVLAVFVASLIASIIPAFKSAESSLGGQAKSLTNVLRAPYSVGPGMGLAPASAAKLVVRLETYEGVVLAPIYSNPRFKPNNALAPPPAPGGRGPIGPQSRIPTHPGQNTIRPNSATGPSRANGPNGATGQNSATGYDSIISCAALREFPALGECAPGDQAVYANANNDLLTDNPLEIDLPIVTAANPVAPSKATDLPLGTLLVKTDNAATLERARTLITSFNATAFLGAPPAGAGLTEWQMGDLEPETFGEVAQVRNNDLTNAENVILAIVGLTLFGAACSLLVTVVGGIVDRKRPFTLLRLSGTPGSTLYKVVLLESVLPLVTASLVAAATGIGVAIPLVKALPILRYEANLALPGPTYYLAMGAGLIVALIVVCCALPLLDRTTQPNNARFE